MPLDLLRELTVLEVPGHGTPSRLAGAFFPTQSIFFVTNSERNSEVGPGMHEEPDLVEL